jgi:hypothetical protein
MTFYREAWAEALWLLAEFKKQVPKAVTEKIQIDYQVNRLDPEFSFYKAVFAKEPKPLIPLGERLQKHSSAG